MRKRLFASALAAAAAAAATVVAFGSLAAAPAMASGQPCGPSVSTSGTGTLGSPYVLKSMYVGHSTGAVTVGEEFEIGTQAAGQVWAVTFSDNGTTFFSGNVTSTAAGVVEVKMNPYAGGTSHMAAHAVSQQTGETVDGSVNLPAVPSACGK